MFTAKEIKILLGLMSQRYGSGIITDLKVGPIQAKLFVMLKKAEKWEESFKKEK